MDRSRLFQDTDWTGASNGPDTTGVLVSGKRGRILTTVYLPGGEDPHPVILFLHGVPGMERLFEFGAAMRQIGFAAVHFHYSGSWGSDGDFSLVHCMEDADSILDWIARNENGWFDTNAVFLAAHSLGGMVGARTLALSPLLKAGVLITPAQYTYKYEAALADPEKDALYRRVYDRYGMWVKGFGWDVLKAEIAADPEAFRFSSYAPALAEKPLLAVAASMDTDVLREDNLDSLAAAVEAQHPADFQVVTLPTNHSLSDQRMRLKELLADFFLKQLPE